jgi:hypothetical protein
VFASCAFAVYTWSILMFLRELPAWLLYLSGWDIIGIFAYAQVFALLESATVLLGLLLLGAILPAQLLREKFVAQGSIAVFLTSGWAIASHIQVIPVWPSEGFFLGAVSCLAPIGGVYVLIHRYERVEEALNSFAERLSVLLYVYVPVSFLSVVIIILRNLSRGN